MIAYYVTYNDFIQLFQISNLTIHDWYRVLIIELVLCSSLCINPNVLFLKVVSKLQILLFAYIVLALLRLGKPNIFL